MSLPWKHKILPGLLCLGYGAVMVLLGGSSLETDPPYHRYQALALLEGRLSLSDDVRALDPGLAWHEGKVQQVWGLGVGLWLAPFQWIGKLAGLDYVPERIALGVAFALLAGFTVLTGLKLSPKYGLIPSIGFVSLILLSPPLWALNLSSSSVLEVTALYAVILSIALLVALIRTIHDPSNQNLLLLCFLAALSIWFRPTHAIYGVIAVGIAAFFSSKSKRILIPGGSLVLISFLLLAWSNRIRFGSPLEFGHRLTVTDAGMVFLTRFANPYAEAELVPAARELAGVLFAGPELLNPEVFENDLVPGQADAPRWRWFSFTIFDLSHLMLLLLAIGVVAFPSHRRTAATLLCWSGVAFLVLSGFYLHYPVITSRYLMDFLPAITGVLIVLWLRLSSMIPKISILLLLLWLGWEFAMIRVPSNDTLIAEQKPWPAARLPMAQGRELSDFNGTYSQENPPWRSDIPFNGEGWDPETGYAGPTVVLLADAPRLLEIEVGPRWTPAVGINQEDTYRANVEGTALAVQSVTSTNDRIRVTFEVPEAVLNSALDRTVFLSFTENFDDLDRRSQRLLHSVRWKESDRMPD